MERTTSSVIVIFDRAVLMGPTLRIRGRKPLIEVYDYASGRKREREVYPVEDLLEPD